jgi:hypothetical protein
MKMILQISTHSILARVRISLLIAEVRIFELIDTVARGSRPASDCLHPVISLTAMSAASLPGTPTWAGIQ